MFTFAENVIVPLMSFIHHNEYLLTHHSDICVITEQLKKIKVTFGDQIMSMQRVSSSCLRHCESSVGS